MESIAEIKRRDLLASTAALSGLVMIMYARTLAWLFERYTSPDSYYSHGFLVPAVSAFLLWKKRRQLARIRLGSSRLGLGLVAAALLLHAVASLAEVYSASSFSFPAVLFGLSLFLFGKRFTRAISFEISFLVFMLPLPLALINSVSFPLKIFVTNVTVAILRLSGVPLRHEGFQLFFSSGTLTVENPCSGLRSLIVFLALGSVFAYTLKSDMRRRLALFGASVPIAIAANIGRVLVLSLGVFVYGSGVARGLFHDMTGYAVFVVAFVVLKIMWRKLK